MLIANKANVLAIDRRGRSALHYAAINGSFECCELLMNAGISLRLLDNYCSRSTIISGGQSRKHTTASCNLAKSPSNSGFSMYEGTRIHQIDNFK